MFMGRLAEHLHKTIGELTTLMTDQEVYFWIEVLKSESERMADAKITLSLEDKTSAGFKKVKSEVRDVEKAVAASGAAAAAGLGLLVATTLQSAEELNNLKSVANTTASEFQRYAAGARVVGVEQDKLADIFKDTNDKVGDFLVTGGGPLADFFNEIAPQIGVTADEFKNLSGPQALQRYFDGLEKANLSQEKLTFFMEAIASDATALIPLLRDGGRGFAQQADEAERLGVVLSDIDAARLLNAQRELNKGQQAVQGLINTISVQVSPVIEGVARELREAALSAGGFGQSVETGFSIAVGTVGALADGVRAINILFDLAVAGVNSFISVYLAGVSEVSRLAGTLTGSETLKEFSAGARRFSEDFARAGDDSIAKAQELTQAILPSEAIQNKIREFRALSDEAAKQAAAQNQVQSAGAGGVDPSLVAEQKRIQERFALLQAETQGELELLQLRADLKLAKDLEFLQSEQTQRILGQEQTNALVEQIQIDHNARLEAIQRDHHERMILAEQSAIQSLLNENINFAASSEAIAVQTAQRQRAIDELSKSGQKQLAILSFREALSIAASGSKKLFELNKKVSLAEATILGFKAIQAGFATQPFLPVGLAMGALATAKTAANIKAIKSTSFSGGTPAGAPTGGVAPPISTQNNPASSAPASAGAVVQGPAVAPRRATVVVEGEIDTREKTLKFAQELVELGQDGFTAIDVVLGTA